MRGRQFAFLGNLRRCRAGINQPARAFGGHSNWWLMSVRWELPLVALVTLSGILELWNEHVSVSDLEFRSRVITGWGWWWWLLCGFSLTLRKVA